MRTLMAYALALAAVVIAFNAGQFYPIEKDWAGLGLLVAVGLALAGMWSLREN